MKGLFNYDSGIMAFLSRVADLVILNFLMILFSIPIVTIGATVTAAHYVALKMRRGEGYVMKNFWKSFKENFKQSTVIWLILAIEVVLATFSLLVFSGTNDTIVAIMKGIVLAGLLFTGLISMWIFPLQSRFINKISITVRNAFILSFKYILRTLGMALSCLVPVALILVLSPQWYSILFVLGFSVPIYWCAMLYDKVFEKIEEMILEEQGESAADVVSDVEMLEITEEV